MRNHTSTNPQKTAVRNAAISKAAAAVLAGVMACGMSACQGSQAADGTPAQETAGNQISAAAQDSSAGQDNTAAQAASAGQDNTAVQTVYVAHTQTYVPFDFVNDKGESDGFEVQVLKAVDELLPQYSFEYVPTTDDDLLIGVESGKYNIGVKGAWFTEDRAKKYTFPENYIGASSIGLVIRSENAEQIKDMESFADFSGKLVPIGPQNAQYTIVDEYNKAHPDKQIKLEASDAFEVSDAYQWVLEGRYDAYFNIKTSYEANVVNADGVYHDAADKLSYVTYEAIPTYPLFHLGDTELAAAYDEAVQTLRDNGTIKQLSEQYFGEDIFQYVK